MVRAFIMSRLVLGIALTIGVSHSARAEESGFYEEGKSRINKMLDLFSSKWIDSGRGAAQATEPAKTAQTVTPDAQGKGAPEAPPDPGPPPRSGRARTTPLWMPYCFLIDPSHDPTDVNKNMKRIVDEYGKCGIAVEPFAFTIGPNYPSDYRQLNDLTRQACDFDRAFGVRGAIQMAVNDPQIPQAMCRDPQAQGCSTLCERLSVSYVAAGAGSKTSVHESLHSNCCGRICVNQGEGLESIGFGIDMVENNVPTKWYQAEDAKKPALADAEADNEELNPDACTTLRQGASPNDGTHRWDPNKLNFYARATDPKAFKPLDGRSFFTAKSGKTPDSNHPGSGGGDEGGKRLGSVTYDDNAKKVGSTAQAGVPGKPDKDSIPGEDPKHRNGANGAGIDPTVQALLGNLKDIEQEAGDIDKLQFVNTPKASPAVSSGGGSKRVSFDDNAKKGSAKLGGGANLGSGGAGGAPGGGAGTIGGGGQMAGFDGGNSGGGGEGGLNIVGAAGGASNSLDGGFFDQIKTEQDGPEAERPRGSTLRPRELAAIKRESSTGLSQQTDVLISTRKDPDRISGEQKATPGAY